MMSFDGKVALVTGARHGHGPCDRQSLRRGGAAVALADVNEAAVRAAAEGLFAGGRKARGFRCNVADEADVSAVMKQKSQIR